MMRGDRRMTRWFCRHCGKKTLLTDHDEDKCKFNKGVKNE